ncbi:cupin [bacterium]|nr:cupin [bacterium]
MTADPGEVFEQEGLHPEATANGPGLTYGRHSHARDKVLVCTSDTITFQTAAEDTVLAVGDRPDLPAGTRHGASVGPSEVSCLEAYRT